MCNLHNINNENLDFHYIPWFLNQYKWHLWISIAETCNKLKLYRVLEEEKGMTEDEMVGWHHWLNGHEFGWTPGVGDGQEGLACCGSWGHKESDMTEQLNWTELRGLSPELHSSSYRQKLLKTIQETRYKMKNQNSKDITGQSIQ